MANAKTRTVFVAYNKRTGLPWAAGDNEKAVADYADANDLEVKSATWIDEPAKVTKAVKK